MTAADARKLIGKRVWWEESGCRYLYRHSAVFLEVAGKNVRVEGDTWLWLPKIGKPILVEEVE